MTSLMTTRPKPMGIEVGRMGSVGPGVGVTVPVAVGVQVTVGDSVGPGVQVAEEMVGVRAGLGVIVAVGVSWARGCAGTAAVSNEAAPSSRITRKTVTGCCGTARE
jgi:hypothetical protein